MLMMTYFHCFFLLIMQINLREKERHGCLTFTFVMKMRNLQLTSIKKGLGVYTNFTIFLPETFELV